MMKQKRKLSRDEVRSFAVRMLYMVAANVIYSLTLNLFLRGNDIAGGGLAGVGIIVSSVVEIPIGLFVLLCNIPIFIWAAFIKDRAYMLTTVICAVVYSLVTDLFAFLPTVTDNLLVASVCAGVMYGVGIMLMARADCSTGGTDLLTKILVTRFKALSLGTMYILVDGLIVIASIVVFRSFELGMYSAIVIAIYSYVSDSLIRGFNKASICYVITEKDPEPMADSIMNEMTRGVTLQRGVGMYGHQEKSILMVVVKPREVYRIKAIVKLCDPNAFVVLAAANEVMGKGFSEIDYTKTKKDMLPPDTEGESH